MKYVRAVDMYTLCGEKIAKDYEDGATIATLAKSYGCSYNTIYIVIGMLGFKVCKWVQKHVDKKIDFLKKEKLKKVRQQILI